MFNVNDFKYWLDQVKTTGEYPEIPVPALADLSAFYTEMCSLKRFNELENIQLEVIPVGNGRVRFNYFYRNSFLLAERSPVLTVAEFLNLLARLDLIQSKAKEQGLLIYCFCGSEGDEACIYDSLSVEYYNQDGEDWISWIEIPYSTQKEPKIYSSLELLEHWVENRA